MKEDKKETTENSQSKPKNKKTLMLIAVVVGILVVLGVVGRIIQKRVSEGIAGGFLSAISGGKLGVNYDKDKVTYKSEEGEFSFQEGGKLPEGFPADFPIYPGAKVASSWTANNEEGRGISVVWESPDSVEKVNAYYKGETESKGWRVTASFTSDGASTYSFEKDSVSAIVGITAGEAGKTTVSATISVK